jgi:amphiphysin
MILQNVVISNSVSVESTHIASDSHTPETILSCNEKTKMEELYDIPVGATTNDLPPGVLYKVRATYKYVAEDADELSFETGEVINVIEYEDPEEQEEGWLMGFRELNGEKGLFPANFTRPI